MTEFFALVLGSASVVLLLKISCTFYEVQKAIESLVYEVREARLGKLKQCHREIDA